MAPFKRVAKSPPRAPAASAPAKTAGPAAHPYGDADGTVCSDRYGWRDSSMSSSSDYSPSAPLDRSTGYPGGSPGYAGGSPGYPGGSPGYPVEMYPGAGHGSLPPAHHHQQLHQPGHQPGVPPVGPGPRWLPGGHGGHGVQTELSAAVGDLQLR